MSRSDWCDIDSHDLHRHLRAECPAMPVQPFPEFVYHVPRIRYDPDSDGYPTIICAADGCKAHDYDWFEAHKGLWRAAAGYCPDCGNVPGSRRWNEAHGLGTQGGQST